MRIVVLIKQVPDTWGERKLDPATGLVLRGESDRVIDEVNERALEAALQYKDAEKDTEVVLLSVGPAPAVDALRKGLSMGADSAVHVLDDGLAGADAVTTAAVLATAVRQTGFDLVIAGNESTDGRGGVVPAAIAEHLQVPHLTFLDSIEITADRVGGERGTEYGTVVVHAELPAVASVTERAPEARFPSFKGIMSAKRKPLTVMTLADLATESPRARSVIVSVTARPPRTAGRKVVDDGSAAAELVDYLATNRLI